MEPPRPDDALPVMSDTQPLLPDALVPELRSKVPEAPAEPALRVDRDTEPDPELTLEPPCKITLPPVPLNALPADREIRPPPAEATEDVEDPDNANTDPTEVPEFELPTAMDIEPPRPEVPCPVTKDTKPLLPAKLEPELRRTAPDTPALATFALETTTDPEPLLKLEPDTRKRAPPSVATRETPPEASDTAPAPTLPLPPTMLMAPPRPFVAEPA